MLKLRKLRKLRIHKSNVELFWVMIKPVGVVISPFGIYNGPNTFPPKVIFTQIISGISKNEII